MTTNEDFLTILERDPQHAAEVAHGIVRSPGKFEASRPYIYWAWNCYLNGIGDELYECPHKLEGGSANCDGEGDILHTIVAVTAEAIRAFPELEGKDEVAFREDDYGFVHEENPVAVRKELS